MIVSKTGKMPFTPSVVTLLALLLSSMLMLMGGAAVAPALPLIEGIFPNREFEISLIVTLPSLAVGCTGFLLGTLADRFGKVKTLCVSLAVFTAGGIASFFLDDLYLILVTRFVVGIGIGGISTTVTALMAEYYMGVRRVKVLSYQSAAMGLGVLILETAGGVLAGISWREPFLIYLIGLPILLLCIVSMREPPKTDFGNAERKPIAADRKILAVCYVSLFVCQMSIFMLPTKIPSFLEDPSLPGHLSTAAVGLLLGLNGVINACVSLCYRRFAQHVQPYGLITLALMLYSVGFIAICIEPSVAAAVFSLVLVGIATGLAIPSVVNTLATQVSPGNSGKIMGGYSMFLNFGQFFISLLAVPILILVNDSVPDLFGIVGIIDAAGTIAMVAVCLRTGGFRTGNKTKTA